MCHPRILYKQLYLTWVKETILCPKNQKKVTRPFPFFKNRCLDLLGQPDDRDCDITNDSSDVEPNPLSFGDQEMKEGVCTVTEDLSVLVESSGLRGRVVVGVFRDHPNRGPIPAVQVANGFSIRPRSRLGPSEPPLRSRPRYDGPDRDSTPSRGRREPDSAASAVPGITLP